MNVLNGAIAKEQQRCTAQIQAATNKTITLEPGYRDNRRDKEALLLKETQEKLARLKKQKGKTAVEGQDGKVISAEKSVEVILRLQDQMLKQRTLWDLRLATTKKKYEEEIQFL